jgi:hypothetical protein
MKHKLISVALIAILLFMVLGNSVACAPTTFTLTVTSTDGGNVTTPGGTYAAGTVVNLTAMPAIGYRFVNWTATAGTFGNATAAATTFTMPSQNATVTAHFAFNMTFIENVPDTNWPPTSNATNFCAPLAMVNILGYWDEVMGDPNAQNLTAWLVPSNLNTVADYVGYFMDTNNLEAANPRRGNDADNHKGTYAKDILMLTGGSMDYVLWDNATPLGNPAVPAGKLGYVWTGVNDYCTDANPGRFSFIETEIDNGRPLVVCYAWWNLIFATNVTDPQSGEVISVYTWAGPSFNSTPPNPAENWTGYETGEGCIGHAVTGVGYILNWDPDGSGGLLPFDNWTIVHDTWATTPKNIAVPWTGAPWNSSHAVLVP